MEKQELCEKCYWREHSRRRVIEWGERGGNGFCLDPSPKAECKRHEGYGHKVENRIMCRDFKEL